MLFRMAYFINKSIKYYFNFVGLYPNLGYWLVQQIFDLINVLSFCLRNFQPDPATSNFGTYSNRNLTSYQ